MRNSFGFTIIELLATSVVMSALATLSYLNFQEYERNINHLKARLDANNIVTSYNSFLADVGMDDVNDYIIQKAIGGSTNVIGGKSLDQLLPGMHLDDKMRYWVVINNSCLVNPNPDGTNCTALALSVTHCKGEIVDIPGWGFRQRSWYYAELNSLSGMFRYNMNENSYGAVLTC